MMTTRFSFSLCRVAVPSVALAALTLLGGHAAQAQTSQLSAALNSPLAYTVSYSGDYLTNNSPTSPVTVAAGGQTVSLSGTGGHLTIENTGDTGLAPGLPTFTAFGATQTNSDGTKGINLLETYDGVAGLGVGPLTISFSSGVSAFGLYAQDFSSTNEFFTYSLYNGSTLLDASPYTAQAALSQSNPTQPIYFVSGQTTGNTAITKVVITGDTNNPSEPGKQDFLVTPVTFNSFPPAVPEANTVALLAAGLGLLGLTVARRRAGAARA